ncbi:unnamed protein product [Durusdinium trenchii]|uniref:Uncharacterized protein n=1 Tax=Durusdinium trenchii TaxID=1381693 RepID=A0ABP0LBH3_9DINO
MGCASSGGFLVKPSSPASPQRTPRKTPCPPRKTHFVEDTEDTDGCGVSLSPGAKSGGAATPSPAPPCVEGGSLGPEGCQLSLPEIEGLVPSMQLTHQDQGAFLAAARVKELELQLENSEKRWHRRLEEAQRQHARLELQSGYLESELERCKHLLVQQEAAHWLLPGHQLAPLASTTSTTGRSPECTAPCYATEPSSATEVPLLRQLVESKAKARLLELQLEDCEERWQRRLVELRREDSQRLARQTLQCRYLESELERCRAAQRRPQAMLSASRLEELADARPLIDEELVKFTQRRAEMRLELHPDQQTW